MRVISQDGKVDIPYDYFLLSIDSGKFSDGEIAIIYCRNLSSPDGTKLARYSTKEKALKAMEMLRKSYENNEFYHHMSTTDTFKDVASLLNNEKFNEVTRECFQFPQDDEIEV